MVVVAVVNQSASARFDAVAKRILEEHGVPLSLVRAGSATAFFESGKKPVMEFECFLVLTDEEMAELRKVFE